MHKNNITYGKKNWLLIGILPLEVEQLGRVRNWVMIVAHNHTIVRGVDAGLSKKISTIITRSSNKTRMNIYHVQELINVGLW